MIYYHRKQLSDISSHQTDEELWAQNMIVFLWFFSLGSFSGELLLQKTINGIGILTWCSHGRTQALYLLNTYHVLLSNVLIL